MSATINNGSQISIYTAGQHFAPALFLRDRGRLSLASATGTSENYRRRNRRRVPRGAPPPQQASATITAAVPAEKSPVVRRRSGRPTRRVPSKVGTTGDREGDERRSPQLIPKMSRPLWVTASARQGGFHCRGSGCSVARSSSPLQHANARGPVEGRRDGRPCEGRSDDQQRLSRKRVARSLSPPQPANAWSRSTKRSVLHTIPTV